MERIDRYIESGQSQLRIYLAGLTMIFPLSVSSPFFFLKLATQTATP